MGPLKDGSIMPTATAANNSFLAEQATSLRRRLQPYRRMQLRVPKRVHDSFDEHKEIVEAILAGASGAVAQTARHDPGRAVHGFHGTVRRYLLAGDNLSVEPQSRFAEQRFPRSVSFAA